LSLRPIRSRRRWNRRSSYGQLQARQNWKPWKGWGRQTAKKTFFSTRKRAIVTLILLALLGVVIVDQALKTTSAVPVFSTAGQKIWHDDTASGTLNNWNCRLASTALPGGTSGYVQLNANSTHSSLCIAKSSFDPSQAVAKELEVQMQYGLAAGGTNDPVHWAWFITRNGTATSWIGSYTPMQDPQVVVVNFVTNTFGNTESTVLFIQRNVGEAVAAEDAGNCETGGSPFICDSDTLTVVPGNANVAHALFNFTGNPGSTTSKSSIMHGSCPAAICTIGTTTTLPWLQIQGQQYHLGIWYEAGASLKPLRWFANHNDNQGMAIWVENPVTLPQGYDTGGFFGPLIKGLISIGILIFNGLVQFINYIRPALMAAWTFFEGWIGQALNILGSLLGYPTLGTDLLSLINQTFQFFTNFTYGLPAAFAQFPTLFTQFLNWLQIVFPILTPAFTLASAITAFGTNGVSILITIFTVGLQLVLFGYAMILIFSFFIFTGDDSLGGLFTYIGTAQALAFKIVNVIALLINYGIDILVHIISLIPKPLIQMYAGKFPRLPVIDTTATITWPSLDFAELRSGNLFVVWLWTIGFYFDVWYESRNPSLPGTIAALVPGTAANMQKLASMLPLLQIFVLIAGGGLLFWLVMRPIQMMGQDLGIFEEFSAGPGRRSGPGPSGFRVKRGQKHELGFVQRRVARAVGLRATVKAEAEG